MSLGDLNDKISQLEESQHKIKLPFKAKLEELNLLLNKAIEDLAVIQKRKIILADEQFHLDSDKAIISAKNKVKIDKDTKLIAINFKALKGDTYVQKTQSAKLLTIGILLASGEKLTHKMKHLLTTKGATALIQVEEAEKELASLPQMSEWLKTIVMPTGAAENWREGTTAVSLKQQELNVATISLNNQVSNLNIDIEKLRKEIKGIKAEIAKPTAVSLELEMLKKYKNVFWTSESSSSSVYDDYKIKNNIDSDAKEGKRERKEEKKPQVVVNMMEARRSAQQRRAGTGISNSAELAESLIGNHLIRDVDLVSIMRLHSGEATVVDVVSSPLLLTDALMQLPLTNAEQMSKGYIIPLNVSAADCSIGTTPNHFVGLHILRPEISGAYIVNYVDPLGRPVHESVKKIIEETFSVRLNASFKFNEIKSDVPLQQLKMVAGDTEVAASNDCGPFLIHIMEHLTTEAN